MGMGGSMTFDSLEVNQYEKGENWVVDVSLNDKEIKDLKVNIENDQLTLSGSMEKKLNDSEDQNGGFFSNGIVSQSFTRQFPLPSGLNSEKMEMKTENGHLLIIIPKS
jgi:HSP20 family molecular chaperone IbpA